MACCPSFSESLVYALSSLKMSHLSLKPEQQYSMEAIYDGCDVFVWLPTGYRKSLCYQALPFLMDSKLWFANSEKSSSVFVVSPLVALVIDQVKSLRSRGVKCSVITSSSDVDKDLIATHSSDSLLFCIPEALVRSKWRDAIDDPVVSGRIVALVIDEAHCVSKL